MKERIKEFREWATFILTALTLVAIPMGAMVLKNQRLEIQSDADKKFQTKEDAQTYQNVTNAKLDKITDAADASRQDLAYIKATLNEEQTHERNPNHKSNP